MESESINVVLFDASMTGLASSFHSGNNYLDRFLKSADALCDGIGKTYVFLSTSTDGDTIIGYYNIGVGYIEEISNNVRRRIGGSAHINCFALDERYHGLLQDTTPDGIKIKLSDVLLYDCINRIQKIRSTEIGFSFITLCSTKEGENLYRRNDFEVLDEDLSFSKSDGDKDCIPMYLPLDYE